MQHHHNFDAGSSKEFNKRFFFLKKGRGSFKTEELMDAVAQNFKGYEFSTKNANKIN